MSILVESTMSSVLHGMLDFLCLVNKVFIVVVDLLKCFFCSVVGSTCCRYVTILSLLDVFEFYRDR